MAAVDALAFHLRDVPGPLTLVAGHGVLLLYVPPGTHEADTFYARRHAERMLDMPCRQVTSPAPSTDVLWCKP